jgi:hypothetical protein
VKILALTSSYRRRGNTARIVHMIETHLEATAARQADRAAPLVGRALLRGL